MGTRLGLGQTKALIELQGRPLIHWQLDLLDAVADVRVVVGYNAPSVINAVVARRRDALFILNHRYAETATGDSLLLGVQNLDGLVLSLDGDLLVTPADMARILAIPFPVAGVGRATTDDAVYAIVDEHLDGLIVTGFSTEPRSSWEWTGLVTAPAELLRLSASKGVSEKRHVYELVSSMLPLPAIEVETSEIDTPADYVRSANWLAKRSQHGAWKT